MSPPTGIVSAHNASNTGCFVALQKVSFKLNYSSFSFSKVGNYQTVQRLCAEGQTGSLIRYEVRIFTPCNLNIVVIKLLDERMREERINREYPSINTARGPFHKVTFSTFRLQSSADRYNNYNMNTVNPSSSQY